jgi:L-ascorbate metabolism protein UlaG (beta-lactamase superfamily)
MKVRWLGHSSFLIISDNGTRVITDPYPSGLKGKLFGLRYKRIRETADVVIISHDHGDHNNVSDVRGNPQVITGEGTTQAHGITFRGIKGSHGQRLGANSVFCFAIDEVRLCHLGDQAVPFTEQQFNEIGEVDILFLPIIRMPLIHRLQRHQTDLELFIRRLNAKVVLPMHFRNWKCWMPLLTIDGYLRNKKLADKMECIKLENCEIEFNRETLPTRVEFLILNPA